MASIYYMHDTAIYLSFIFISVQFVRMVRNIVSVNIILVGVKLDMRVLEIKRHAEVY